MAFLPGRLGRARVILDVALCTTAVVLGACGGSSGSGEAPDGGRQNAGDGASPSPDGSIGPTGDAGGADSAAGDATTGTPDSGPASDGPSSGDAAPESACTSTNPNVDLDQDGWTPAQGDCNDCDPLINPGAVDLPGLPHVDSDCDGVYDPPQPCDTALALDDVVAVDGAKTIELCRSTTLSPPLPQKTWGVISANYVRADGTAYATPGLQVGLEPTWGTNVAPQAGAQMLVLSSGHARTTAQPGACGSESCSDEGLGTAPAGFPQDITGCPPATNINDDVGLEIQVRVPTNVTGYGFNLKFYSMEFPYYVCDSYNDQFVVLASPAPTGAINGNIVFDSSHNPVGVNVGYMDDCDPSQISDYAVDCQNNGGTCPTPPSPYCPSGPAQLAGTGFDVWNPTTGNGTAGATDWLTAQAPAQPGQVITIRFAVWDTGDQLFDSTILIDNFHWIAAPAVSVSTQPTAAPVSVDAGADAGGTADSGAAIDASGTGDAESTSDAGAD